MISGADIANGIAEEVFVMATPEESLGDVMTTAAFNFAGKRDLNYRKNSYIVVLEEAEFDPRSGLINYKFLVKSKGVL